MWTMRRRKLGFLMVTSLALTAMGCATEDSVQSLEKRVAALEEKQKAKATEDQDRQSKLENCVTVDANDAYWNYIQLNGKPVAGRPGVYTAALVQWDQAEKRKRDKIEECKLLYEPR